MGSTVRDKGAVAFAKKLKILPHLKELDLYLYGDYIESEFYVFYKFDENLRHIEKNIKIEYSYGD